MYEEYVKDMPVEEKTDEDKEIELILSIIKTKNELETANRNFEYADKELIDYYTYQIKANQAKLDYLVKKAKTKGLVLDMISGIELNSYSA
ncbi:MAG: YaaL family protein [Clostridia bacterium]|jgi:hypothetical protein